MLRKIEKFSGLLLTALVASAIGCSADSPSAPSNQIVGPTTPTTVSVSLVSSKKSLFATSETFSVLTATVTKDGLPIPDLTEVTITTTLGNLDSPTGATSVKVLTSGGKVVVNFWPGSVEGTARLTASVLGAIGITTVTILPASGIVEPPAASTLEISTTTTSVSAADPSTAIDVTATVLGSDTKPFKSAPVQFSATVGLFSSSGATIGNVLKTNSSGKAFDTLNVNGSDLTGVSSITITVTLFVEGGGSIAKSLSIPVGAAPTATKITLTSDNLFVNDDGSDQNLNLTAHVQDASLQDFPGATVTFSSASFPSASFAPTSATTDSGGLATSTATMTSANVAAFGPNTFTITATIGSTSSTITITIVRKPQAAFTFNGTLGTYTVNFVNQSTPPGGLTFDWDFDTSSASTDSTVASPQHTYPAVPASFTVRLTVTNSAGSSTVFQTVTVPNP